MSLAPSTLVPSVSTPSNDIQFGETSCDVCRRTNLLCLLGGEMIPGGDTYRHRSHHKSFRDLSDAADKGCQVCIILKRMALTTVCENMGCSDEDAERVQYELDNRSVDTDLGFAVAVWSQVVEGDTRSGSNEMFFRSFTYIRFANHPKLNGAEPSTRAYLSGVPGMPKSPFCGLIRHLEINNTSLQITLRSKTAL